MDPTEFDTRYFGLRALQSYLIESVDSDQGVNTDELYMLLVDSCQFVRDSGGDMKKYIDLVCDSFPTKDDAAREQLREELWKISSL